MKCVLLFTCVVALVSPSCVALPNTPTEAHNVAPTETHNVAPIEAHNVAPTESQNMAKTITLNASSAHDNLSGHFSRLTAKNDTHDLLNDGQGAEGGHGGGGERYPVIAVHWERVQTPFIICVWIMYACFGKLGFHLTPKLSHVFPESCMLVLLGIAIGVVLYFAHAATINPFTADVFFLYLIPPIVLDAGYFMPNRLFFDHLGTILVYAVLGTIWNSVTIGVSMYAVGLTGIFGTSVPILHMFLFSSLISAVDPVAVLAVFEELHVEEVLYILVFGESLLNDAVTVVLYNMFAGYSTMGLDNIQVVDIFSGILSFLLVSLGGTAIGIVWGFLTAFVTRFTSGVRVIEPIFVFVMAYLAYLNAEIFHLSGLLSITFCGITMKNYVDQNISNKSHTTIKHAMKMLASSSETVIFMFLGVSTVQSSHEWDTWFVMLTIIFCSLYRIIGVWMLTAMCNRYRVKKIEFVDKFILSYGGIRGAVAFALVLTVDPHQIPMQPIFLTATMAMVYFTVFLQGITIKPLTIMLGVKKAVERILTMNERLHERSFDYITAGMEDVAGRHGNLLFRKKFKRLNNKYLTPFLVHKNTVMEPKFIETFSNIKMQEAINYMENNDSASNNTKSFTNLLRNAVTHPYLQNNHQGEWNLDVGELEYKTGMKDIDDAKLHHLLSIDYLAMRRHQSLTYLRHAVKDDEWKTRNEAMHRNMYLYSRKFTSNNRKQSTRKRVENGDAGQPVEGDVRAAFRKIGSDIKLESDYMDHVMADNPAFVDDEGVVNYTRDMPSSSRRRASNTTVAEAVLPWKRYHACDAPKSARNVKRKISVVPDGGGNVIQTMTEVSLPWKRTDDSDRPVQQTEFPAWASNKEYLLYYSPSNTLLGGLGKHESYPNIREIFGRRSSSGSSLTAHRDSLKDSLNFTKDKTSSTSLQDKFPSRNSLIESTLYTSSLLVPDLSLNMRRHSHTGEHSLLNTTIKEEEGRRDAVIEVIPDREQTRM
uniref:Sodium/hydrogen exchanger n=1 Tax=Cherax cainii TaxID=223846 RepID=A0A0C5DFF2_9EUCA|nr:sodium-hydrogen exchanger 3 [Cherax cainii]